VPQPVQLPKIACLHCEMHHTETGLTTRVRQNSKLNNHITYWLTPT